MEISAQQDRLLAIVAEVLGVDPRSFPEPMSTKLADDLKSDSLDAVELVMSGEEEFSIEISEQELNAFAVSDAGSTVGDLWKVVEPKLVAA